VNRWDAVARRDRSQDGRFYYGVLTTGVYCRPSCPARRPLPRNVRFYASPEDAERDGLRPCRRCHPRQPDPIAARIDAVCQFIRDSFESGGRFTLEELSRRAGLSAGHFERRFKAVTGATPRQFVDACRWDALKRQLRAQSSVTDAIYLAGFSSSSVVYQRAGAVLGMTPAEYRRAYGCANSAARGTSSK
jgi:AraC family transcriptional regulator of adaptative response/methylated-DNA-[protein]-cysteine methyltransferase